MLIKHINELFALNNSAFVVEAYHNLLQRKPDQHGLSYYLGRLALGHSRSSIIFQLTKSNEYRPNHTIGGLEELLAREKKYSHWFYRLFMLKKNNEQINSLITIMSDINQSISESNGAIIHLKERNHLAQTALAREPIDIETSTESDIQYLESKLREIQEKIKIKQPFTAQKIFDLDGEDFIEAVYESILHRKVDEDGKGFFLSEMEKGLSKKEILTHIIDCEEALDQPDNFIYLNAKIDMAISAIDGIWNHIKRDLQ